MLSHAGPMDRTLVGGLVQRATVAQVGRQEIVLLQVRLVGETVHIAIAGAVGVGVVDSEARAALRETMDGATSPAQAKWRARVHGARITHVGVRDLRLSNGGKIWRVRGEPAGGVALEEVAPEGGGGLASGTPETAVEKRTALEERGAAMAEALVATCAGGRRQTLERALAKALARLERRATAVRGDLARAASADEVGRRAQLFVPSAAHAPRGATKLVAIDWSSGEPKSVEMALDPARQAQAQIDALFQRARRLKEGMRIGHARLADAEKAIGTLRELASTLAKDATAKLEELEARARNGCTARFQAHGGAPLPSRGRNAAPLPPYRVFLGTSGHRILVGRSGEKNDALSFHIARPHDLWLHAKGYTGAHVVVPLAKGASCAADLLVDAAHLAVHFSEARGERSIEIQYTPRRYLRKPRGSAPGLVVVDREKVIALRCDDDCLRRLLESEVDAS